MAEIAGLKLIVPSSVAGSGVSVSASGKVTFTAATSISVNGVFDSTYDNYLVVMRHISSSGDSRFDLRLRSSGSDATGSNYTYQDVNANSTTVSGARFSGTFASVCFISSTAASGTHCMFYGPALAQPTAIRSVNAIGRDSARIKDQAITHSVSSTYDGFSFLPSSLTLSGALTVYGLSQ